MDPSIPTQQSPPLNDDTQDIHMMVIGPPQYNTPEYSQLPVGVYCYIDNEIFQQFGVVQDVLSNNMYQILDLNLQQTRTEYGLNLTQIFDNKTIELVAFQHAQYLNSTNVETLDQSAPIMTAGMLQSHCILNDDDSVHSNDLSKPTTSNINNEPMTNINNDKSTTTSKTVEWSQYKQDRPRRGGLKHYAGCCAPLWVCCDWIGYGCFTCLAIPQYLCDKYNKWCTSLCFIIGIIFTLSMATSYTNTYVDRLEDPSEFHYTSCIITNIDEYKVDDNDNEWNNKISFIYSINNSDWSEEGIYDIPREDWDNHYREGDIGTCLYSENAYDKEDRFTMSNYLINPHTSAMWLIMDDKIGLLLYLIFFVVVCVLVICNVCSWVCGRIIIDDDDNWCSKTVKCDHVQGQYILYFALIIFIIGLMIVGWPMMIMGSIIQNGLNGKLGHNIYVDDVYENIGDCMIKGIHDTVHYTPTDENTLSFVMIKYDVFLSDYGNMTAIDINTFNTTDNSTYFEDGSIEDCYMNVYTQQIILSEYPNVDWLEPPMKVSTSIWIIIGGCMLICLPCVVALLYLCAYLCRFS